ncbi:oocyte zinc finger protein XlCOF20-like [Battus philenor]|uniref:oocyte zinc finger protein XlCOF20-like n=1 Tax=Battus philenor TaxID=42288 RepID=UPI0035D0DF7D
MFYCSFVSIHYIICECGDTFPTEDALKEHLEREHNHKIERREEFRCDTCDKVFASEKACLIHQRVHTYTQHRIRDKPKEPKEKKPKVKRYYNSKNIVCEVCGKRYASNAALRYHQRVHTGERPYQCSECPKTFTMPLFLQIHMRTHTGERPYECPRCPKAFSNKAALLRHDRVHTGVKPYVCPQCGKTFTQSNSMKLHVKTVHLKMPAPYKSKNRRNKSRGLKVEVQVESGVFEQELAEIKPEVKSEYMEEYPEEYQEEYHEGEGLVQDDTDEQEAQLYAQDGEVFHAVYEQGLYHEEIVEDPQVALYEIEKAEVLYEEVYEDV